MQQQRSDGEMLKATTSLPGISQDETRPDKELSSAVSFASPGEVAAVEGLRVLDGEDGDDGHQGDDDGGSEEDFEFAVAAKDSFDGLEAVTADEIFSNGLISPIYPLFDRALVFGGGESSLQGSDGGVAGSASSREAEMPDRLPLRLRELMTENRDLPSASSSESDDLEGVPAGSYCVWAPASVPPSPDLRSKSHSTGAASKRWRLRSLAVGRSHSDGKERLVFLQSAGTQSKKKAESPEAGKKGKGKGRGGGRATEIDMVTADRLSNARGGAAAGDRRRSFLRNRKELLPAFLGGVVVLGSFQSC